MTEPVLTVYIAVEAAMLLALALSALLIPLTALAGKAWRNAVWTLFGVHMLGLTYFWVRGLAGNGPAARYYVAFNGMFVLCSGLVILVRQTRLRHYWAEPSE